MRSDSKLPLSRRGFGGLIAAAAAGVPAALAQQSTTTAAPEQNTTVQLQRRWQRPADQPPFGETIEFARANVKAKVEPFAMTQVRVTGGPLKDAQEWNRGYMTRLGADRLLYNFRHNAGLDVGSAKPFGGWETPGNGKRDTELRGHFTGHYLSAAALNWASTGDRDIKAKADYMVDELAKIQRKQGGTYLSAFPVELFERLDKIGLDANGRIRRDGPEMPWAPFYTIHKIHAGLIDMYRFAGNKQALDVALRLSEWIDSYTKSKTEAHMQEILTVEFGGIAESLYELGAVTNDDRWIRVGDRFSKKRFLNPLGLRRDDLRFQHVNTHIPQIIAAARRYELSGDMRFRDLTDFFWYETTSARSYVTTGQSNGESWQAEPLRMAHELYQSRTTATGECCCSYNMLKLARHLYSWSGDVRYFDYYERALFNHRLGTILPEKGYTQYYLSLVPGAWKTFNDEDQCFWCCTGTGVEEYSKLNDSIYWRDAEGLYVNLFIPSELNWTERGFSLRQETKFPNEGATALVVTSKAPVRMTIRLRIPSWLASEPVIKINGKPLETSAAPASYFAITREWRAGDRIELVMPMRLTVEAMHDDATQQAFLYGPLVLAGDLGAQGLTERHIIGPSGPWFAPPGMPAPVEDEAPKDPPPVPPIDVPSFKAHGDINEWVKPGDAPMTFRTVGQQKNVTLRPFNSLFNTRYAVYWKVS